MRKGTPEQFIAELTNKISELKHDDIESARVIVEEDDVITAEEDIVDDVVDVPEETEFEDSDEDYLDGLYNNVETELNDMVQGVAWSSDEENIYMDVSFSDDHIITFTIPREDLMFDLASMDKDVNYICTAVRESNPSEPAEEELPSAEELGVQMEIDSEPPVYM